MEVQGGLVFRVWAQGVRVSGLGGLYNDPQQPNPLSMVHIPYIKGEYK